MENYFVIPNIHGRVDLLQLVLRDWDRKTERLVLLGDYIDYGNQSKQALDEVRHLRDNYGAVVLKGDHEAALTTFVRNRVDAVPGQGTRLSQGRRETLHSLLGPNADVSDPVATALALEQKHEQLLRFMEDLPVYLETERYLFVHAGVDLYLDDWHQTPPETFLTIQGEFLRSVNRTGKTIVFAHTRTGVLRGMAAGTPMSALAGMPFLEDDAWISPCETKIGLDGGAVFGGLLHGLHVSDATDEALLVTFKQDGSKFTTPLRFM